MMSGYSWQHGKSNNAVAAERRGLVTASAFARWARRWRRYRGCTAADVAAAVAADEWHHTSKYYRETRYYSRESLIDEDCRRELAAQVAARREAERLWRAAVAAGRVTGEGQTAYAWVHLRRGGVVTQWHTIRRPELVARDSYRDRLRDDLARGYAVDED